MNKTLHFVVGSCCAYEVAALASHGKLPTLSMLDKKCKHTVAPIILGGLTLHFYWRPDDNEYPSQWRLRLR